MRRFATRSAISLSMRRVCSRSARASSAVYRVCVSFYGIALHADTYLRAAGRSYAGNRDGSAFNFHLLGSNRGSLGISESVEV